MVNSIHAAALSLVEARREERARAERKWRRASTLPKLSGIMVLTAMGLLTLLPFLELGPFRPIVAGFVALLCVLGMMIASLVHKAAFMGVQKSRGVSEQMAEHAYRLERPFA